MYRLTILSALLSASVWADDPAPPKPLAPVVPLSIIGETKVAPYRLVRLKAEGVAPKYGIVWKVNGPNNKAIDYASKRNGPELAFVGPPGDYRIELTSGGLIDGGSFALDSVEITVTVIGPTPLPPTPVPTPGPTPGPLPTPAPIDDPGLQVLILEDPTKRTTLTPAQMQILFGTATRNYLDSVCAASPDGQTKRWGIYDPTLDLSGISVAWNDAAKRPHATLPWVLISNGSTGFEGPLPGSADDFKALISKYVGGK